MNDQSHQIIDLLKSGNEKAIDLIFDSYGGNLYGYILQMVKDENAAQDIFQNGMLKIWKNADKYDPSKSKLFTWLLTICRNLAIDYVRSRKTKREKEVQIADSFVYNNESSTTLNIDVLDMRHKVEELDPKYKSVINALFFMGLTQKEASEHLGIPLGTVKTRLKIGLRELKEIFKYNKGIVLLIIVILCLIG